MNATVDRFIVSGGNEFQPISSDTIAVMSPYRVTRQMRGGVYVTTVVDQGAQIGGDMPTRFLLSESEELVASDGHHITLCPGALLGVMKTGRIIDGLMLSGKKVRDEYPSHWLNSPQWLRFRAEAMDRGESVFEGIRRLRVRCGSTAVNNDRPIFFQRRGFGGGAFFVKEPFVEAQLADDYLLLDDGIPVERYTAEFYKKRPFIGVRPERIRPGEVFDLTIVICDPESFDNLLITRADGLRTPDVRVKVNDVDITPALAEKFAGFNPFGYPSTATSPYPGFRLVWPQMKIDEEMPLKIAVEVHDALGNVNQSVQQYSIANQPLLFDFFDFPRGLYAVPQVGLQKARDNGFNLVLPDNYTSLSATGCHRWGLTAMLTPWLEEAKRVGLRTMPWLGANLSCPLCAWTVMIDQCLDAHFYSDGIPYVGPPDKDKIDIVELPDEPVPIDTLWVPDPKNPPTYFYMYGCSIGGQDCPTPGPCDVIHEAIAPLGDIKADDYRERQFWPPYLPQGHPSPQVFFEAPLDSLFHREGWDHRVENTCAYLRQKIPRSNPVPLHINLFTQGISPILNKYPYRTDIWKLFMRDVDYFSIDYYPTKFRDPLANVAWMMDEMHEARDSLNKERAAANLVVGPVQMAAQGLALPQPSPALKPELWFVLDFGDAWSWDPENGVWTASWATYPGCPTGPEYECMTYLALTHGAKGLLYFAYPDHSDAWPNYRPPTIPPPKDPHPAFNETIWATAARINNELRDLSHIINSQDAPETIEVFELHRGDLATAAPDQVLGELERAAGPLDGAIRSAITGSISELTQQSSAQPVNGRAVGGPQPSEGDARGSRGADPAGSGSEYGYSIHTLGRRELKDLIGNVLGTVIHPRRFGFDNYVVTVNATTQPVLALFKCNWVPGFHKAIPAMEVEGHYAEVIFEWELRPPIPEPRRRRIPLAFVGDPRAPWLPVWMFFVDVFLPYQRHVYKVPGSPWDAVFARFPQPVVQRILTQL